MTVARILRARVAGRKFSSLRPPPLFLGANWKCSLEDAASVDALVDDLNAMRRADDGADGGAQLELCVNPPHVFLDRVPRPGRARARRRSTRTANTGATTAAVSAAGADRPAQPLDRRNVLGEGDALIAAAAAERLAAGLGINLTLGEPPRRLAYAAVDPAQLGRPPLLAASAPGARRARVEPVWAIGPGATPCEAPEAQRVCGRCASGCAREDGRAVGPRRVHGQRERGERARLRGARRRRRLCRRATGSTPPARRDRAGWPRPRTRSGLRRNWNVGSMRPPGRRLAPTWGFAPPRPRCRASASRRTTRRRRGPLPVILRAAIAPSSATPHRHAFSSTPHPLEFEVACPSSGDRMPLAAVSCIPRT